MSAQEQEHSPLPWGIALGYSAQTQDVLIDANGNFVTRIDGANFLVDEANVHLIVTAVNSHAELLAAAKRIVAHDAHGAQDWTVIDDLKAAIAHAEESASCS